MNWLHYLAEANLYLAVFYLVYSLLLSRETHYQLNRTYLLFSCIAAFALPVLQVGALKSVLKPADKSANYTMLPDRILEKTMQFNANTLHAANTGNKEPKASAIALRPMKVAATPVAVKPQLKLIDYFWYVYLVGASVMLVLLMARLISLFLLTRRATVVRYGKYKLIQLPGTNVAFSFFGYLFLGDNAPATDTVITHELVHIRQKHSADIIFLELLKVFNWFNPLIYLLQNSLKAIHEYIADQQTVSHQTDALTYATFLVGTAHGTGGSSITHSFFNRNLLKKRIIMLNQKPSGNSARLKYLVIAPLCAMLLCLSTLAFSKDYGFIDLDPAKAVTMAIKPFLHVSAPVKPQVDPIINQPDNQPKQAEKVASAAKDKINPESDENAAAPAMAAKDLTYKPFVSNGGYYVLAHYLHKAIHYAPAADEQGTAVEVGFRLDNDLKINDLKIETSAGDKLDNEVLEAFKNYKGTVNDDAGKYLKFTVYFYTGNYDVLKSKLSSSDAPSGAILVTASPYKFKVTPKGYEYDEDLGYRLPDGRQKSSAVWVYLKDGSSEYYQQNIINDSQAALLKNKYGYNYPSNTYTDLEYLPAINGNTDKYAWNAIDVNSYLQEPYTKAFYDHIYNNLQYPANQKTDLKTSVVLVKFNLDQSGMINNVSVAKSGGTDFDQAAVDAVKSYTGGINDDAGQHTIAIVFCLALNNTRPVVNESFKKDGYVGEVAHAEHKSAFDNLRFTSSKPAEGTEKK